MNVLSDKAADLIPAQFYCTGIRRYSAALRFADNCARAARIPSP